METTQRVSSEPILVDRYHLFGILLVPDRVFQKEKQKKTVKFAPYSPATMERRINVKRS